jgi:hypothetical protein
VVVVLRSGESDDYGIVDAISRSLRGKALPISGNEIDAKATLELSNITVETVPTGKFSGKYDIWSGNVRFDLAIMKPNGAILFSKTIDESRPQDAEGRARDAARQAAVADAVAFFEEHQAATIAALSNASQ